MAVHLTALCYFVKNAQLAHLLFITSEYDHTFTTSKLKEKLICEREVLCSFHVTIVTR